MPPLEGTNEKQNVSVVISSLPASSQTTPNKKPKAETKTLTKKKVKILASVVYGNLFLGSCYSLMAPFFPAEAESKGATATEYGMIFGIYQLIMFLSSPVYGKLVPKLKTGFMMKTGMLVSGICAILFGTLKYAPPGKYFVALAFLIRIIDALGAAAFLTASYTTLGCELSDIIGRAMSVVETAFAFGLAGGPVLGGILYQAGGFSVPFFTVGCLLLTGTVVNFFLFSDTGDVVIKSCSARKVFSNLDFLLNVVTIFVCFATLGFNEATLEPHLRQFELSPTAVGGIFLISGIIDAVAAPLWGFIAEKVSNAQQLTLVACVLMIICFIIIGPLPFLSMPTLLWIVIVSQFLLGLGMSGEIICSFTHGMKETVNQGFPDDEATYGMVSGLLFSSGCCGGFIGPSIGGVLIDNIGYRLSTGFIVALQAVVGFLISLRLIKIHLNKKRSQRNAENGPDTTEKWNEMESSVCKNDNDITKTYM